MRHKHDEIHRRISNLITWQESEDGRKVDMPKLEESHKDILFIDWDSRLKQTETTIVIAVNNIIEAINENLEGANLVTECVPRFLPNVK